MIAYCQRCFKQEVVWFWFYGKEKLLLCEPCYEITKKIKKKEKRK